jgi:ketosteroid isomerase-like protein
MHMDHDLIDQTKRLDNATRYDIDALDSLYSDDFLIYRFSNRGEAMIFDKQATMAFFAGKRDEGEAHQDGDTVELLHASKSGDVGMVVGKRTLQIGDKPEELLFTQIWQRHVDGWQIIRESVYAQAVPGT